MPVARRSMCCRRIDCLDRAPLPRRGPPSLGGGFAQLDGTSSPSFVALPGMLLARSHRPPLVASVSSLRLRGQTSAGSAGVPAVVPAAPAHSQDSNLGGTSAGASGSAAGSLDVSAPSDLDDLTLLGRRRRQGHGLGPATVASRPPVDDSAELSAEPPQADGAVADKMASQLYRIYLADYASHLYASLSPPPSRALLYSEKEKTKNWLTAGVRPAARRASLSRAAALEPVSDQEYQALVAMVHRAGTRAAPSNSVQPTLLASLVRHVRCVHALALSWGLSSQPCEALTLLHGHVMEGCARAAGAFSRKGA